MKERPILFSAPMVRAILEGRKTQTRRVVKVQPGPSCCIEEGDEGEPPFVYSSLYGDGPGYEVHESRAPCRCPYGAPGDRLWVRETWMQNPGREISPDGNRHDVIYRADECHYGPAIRWRPSIHMPRWASRIDLEVTGVRVERLQDISEEGAIAEGVGRVGERFKGYMPLHTGGQYDPALAKTSFSQLWESINGDGSWDANPWVWVVEFNRAP